ncbi:MULTISPECIES: SMI1/KNR4 family protein [unclassified Streptomyces]|uniref:SMI1/KNR4 family protein n=1 Tax=unclassified Streptomyces TaxID=2593676 RepID=UPI0033D3D5A0
MMRFEWRPFLERWSAEWADGGDTRDERGDGDREARAARWLGFAPAGEERLVALEERLGCPLPPSLRSFLQVTDGWRPAGTSVRRLAGTEGIDWCADPHGGGGTRSDARDTDTDTDTEKTGEAGLGGRCIRLTAESEMVDVLLDPDDVDERGEWAVHTYTGRRGAAPERHGSFKHFMEDLYEEFLGTVEGVSSGSVSVSR